jgi:hypothetical protein
MIEPLFISIAAKVEGGVVEIAGPFIKNAADPKLVTVPELVTVELLLEMV